MSITTENETSSSPAPDPVLTAKLSSRWALKPLHVAILAGWCLLFLVLNYLPLRGSDLWGHVSYGKWIVEHQQLPSEDPFLPLAEGVPLVDTAWLAQLTLHGVQTTLGGEGLSALFALTTLASFVFLARAFFLQTRHPLLASSIALLALIVGWSRLGTIRPEMFGVLGFAILLWLIVRSGEPQAGGVRTDEGAKDPDPVRIRGGGWALWIGVPLLFGLWANLHGSFVCGLAVMGCFFLAHTLQTAWQMRDFQAVIADGNVRRWLYLCELAVAATLLNPYGIDLLLYTLKFGGNENLQDILEWQPLRILGVGGREFALSWVLLLVLARLSKRSITVAQVLLLGLFGIAAVYGIRMLGWYAAVFGIVAAPHVADIWYRWFPRVEEPVVQPVEPEEVDPDAPPIELPSGRRWSYSLVGLLLVWVTFALSPIGRPLLGDDPRTPDQLYEGATPLALTEYLKQNPPAGQVYNPQWWGDWLVWQSEEEFQPFMTTFMHLAPAQVWQDYQRISQTQPGWQRVLDRYRVDTVIVDRKRQEGLDKVIRRESGWRFRYEDELSAVYTRRGEPSSETPQDETPQDETATEAASPAS